MINQRISIRMADSQDVRLTWPKAQAGFDLAEYNARLGGRWSRRTMAKEMEK